MRNKKRVLVLGLSSVAVFSMVAAAALVMTSGGAKAAVHASITQTHLKLVGTSSFAGSSAASGGTGLSANNEVRQDPGSDQKTIANNPTVPTNLPTTAPNPTPNNVAGSNPGLTGFNGLNHRDQRLANNGNQFSLEPPDQGLCVGGDYTVEAVNTALAVYNSHTHALVSGPTALNPFFGFAPELTRNTKPIVFGPFTSDPKCYFDASTGHWFITILEIDTDPVSGAFGTDSHELLAVSQTTNPTGAYSIFSIDGSDPTGAGCPCFGDQPLIGADANGFYISTNEFPISGPGFNGAQIYAISKQGLIQAAESGSSTLPTVVHIDASQALAPYGGLSYSIQPATTPPGADFAYNTEYFLSALQFTGVLDNRIAVWSLSNTGSLRNANPNVSLDFKVIESETYGQPNSATQKSGPQYLGAALGEPVEMLQTNDDRMNQVVYVKGMLYGAVNTIIGDGTRTGIAYFRVHPKVEHGSLSANMAGQGYVTLANDSVFYPSIAVNSKGQGLMSFTISGPDYYPSSGYVMLNGAVAGDVHVAAAGQGVEDGFTGYPEYGGNGASRWGDYSAAGVNVDGSFWFADEYIAHPATDLTTRTSLANWATFVGNVHVGD